MRILTVCTVALLAIAPSAACAQRLSELPAGTLVRVETTTGDVFIGPLLDVATDSVRLKSLGKNAPAAVPLANIRSYATGGGPDRGRGFWIGTRLGGGIGLVTLALAKSIESGQAVRSGLSAFKAAQVFAVAATLFGAGIGTKMAPERWIPPRDSGSASKGR
jgi:hypothetical protein